jgi:CubicO group peptidase (beta-lactamase class C family)
MNIDSKFKNLIVVAFLSGMSSFGAQCGEGDIDLAPEATTTEVALSFRDIPYLKKAFIDATPVDRKDGIPVGKLGIDGGNKAMIVKLAQEIADNKYGPYDSLLIAHKDKLIFESYYSRGRINLPHFQASATKVYTGLALGRAIQLGYLTMADLDRPLISFLKELDLTKLVEGVEKITLHQAMTMRSGIRLSKEQREEFGKNPGQLKGQGQVQVYLEHSATITSESQNFKYQFDPMLVMQVLEAVVPGTAKDFIKEELLEKIGITNYRWPTDVSGLPRSGSGSNMTSRDMLKWGTLAANKGKWNGERLVPEAFIAKATSRILTTGDDDVYGGGKDVSNQGYGYYWWNADLKVGNKSYFSASAQGGGGQYIVLIEEFDLMVVVTAHDNDNITLQLIAERILPAFIQHSTSAKVAKSESSIKFPLLKGPYMGQKPPGLVAEPFAPGIISKDGWELEGVFAPGMKEFYFTLNSDDYANPKTGKFRPTVIGFRQENNIWTKFQEFRRRGEVTFSPDGKRMHMAKGYKERVGDGWSERKSLGPMFDRKDWGIMRLTSSAKGSYVFDDYKNKDTIRISTVKNGKRQAPKKMGPAVNSGQWTAHPFIAPDESYLIWDSERDDGYGDSDLYISFKQKDGSWGPAINMGEGVNSDKWDAYASVTPDGKYILFNRRIDDGSNEDVMNVDVYWVDAKIIETLKAKQ